MAKEEPEETKGRRRANEKGKMMEALENIMGIIWTLSRGVFFYALRCRNLLLYGVIELAVALAIIIVTYYPPSTTVILIADSHNNIPGGSVFSLLFATLASIYIMVRGLDNIDKGLPIKWRAKWDHLFYNRKA
jgi:hypothetical protein